MMRLKYLPIFVAFFTIASTFVLKENRGDEKRSESEMIKYIQALEEFSPKSQQETIQKYGEKEENKVKNDNENKMMQILVRLNNWLGKK